MLNYMHTLRFHPRHCGSPDAITPKKVLRHHREAQGRYGGTGTVPSIIVQHLEFHSKVKGILTERFFLKYEAGFAGCLRMFLPDNSCPFSLVLVRSYQVTLIDAFP
jgi:hypothetical protein